MRRRDLGRHWIWLLAAVVLGGAAGAETEPEPAAATRGPVASADEGPAAPREGGRSASGGDGGAPFGFDFGGGDEPLAIESDELEVVQKDGRRHLVFTTNVRVRQGEMTLLAAALEAFYPEGGGQPDRLMAKGDVEIAQGDQKARCDRLDYDRLKERLVCRGNASFEEGENRLSGEVIEIDLHDEKIKVKGGASVLIQPDKNVKEEGDRTP